MSVKDRIIEYCQTFGIKPGRFERECGLSNAYLSKLRHEPSRDKLEQILNTYPDLNPEWLLKGVGPMTKAPKNSFSQMTESEIGETFSEVLMEMFKMGEIYSANMYNKAVAERDKRIEELQRKIWELERENENK